MVLVLEEINLSSICKPQEGKGAAEPDLELDRAQFFSFELEKVRFRARIKPEPLNISQWRA